MTGANTARSLSKSCRDRLASKCNVSRHNGYSIAFDKSVWPIVMLRCGPPAGACTSLRTPHSWRRCRVASPPSVRDEIGDGHGLVAVGTVTAGANPAAEDATLGA